MLVSLGSGATPPARRERSLSTYLETGSVLIESATDVERVAGALATLAPLVPGLRYFRCQVSSGIDKLPDRHHLGSLHSCWFTWSFSMYSAPSVRAAGLLQDKSLSGKKWAV